MQPCRCVAWYVRYIIACCIGASGFGADDAPPFRSAPQCDALNGVMCGRYSIGRRAGFAVAERRCDALGAQYSGRGGVIDMAKGTALFEAVAISDTGADFVRESLPMRDARWGGCRRTGCGWRHATGVTASAVCRLAAAASCEWTMGTSRSRAARSRSPWQCVCTGCISMSRIACKPPCFAPDGAHGGACHVAGMPRGVGDTLYASCCTLQYVVQCVPPMARTRCVEYPAQGV